MTDIWKLPNGNYARWRGGCAFVVYAPGGKGVADYIDTLPADAVPMVPETGRQVTGEELFDAWENGFSAFSRQAEHEQRAWNSAAERLNLRVRETEPRQPWDVLREAANTLDALGGYSLSAPSLRSTAAKLEAAAKKKAQRDREIDKAIKAYFGAAHGGVPATVHEHVRKGMAAVLDVVRGEQA